MLTATQRAAFERDGVIVIENVLDEATVLAPLQREYESLLRRLCDGWAAAGALSPQPASASMDTMTRAAYRAGLDYFQPLDISLPNGPIAAETPFHTGPAAFALLTAPALLDVVEALIGPEITSIPIQHVRIKPPTQELHGDEIRSHVAATDWHQDRGVTLEEADQTTMVTAWVAITDATEENGCLRAIPGSHRRGLQAHCPNPQVGIPQSIMSDLGPARALPVRRGGVVLFHPLTVHGSLENRSTSIRWSFDLRYAATGQPSGRPAFPGFVARSRARPETVLRDPVVWAQSWAAARARLAQSAEPLGHRWAADAPLCA